jgi:hypothetical protein
MTARFSRCAGLLLASIVVCGRAPAQQMPADPRAHAASARARVAVDDNPDGAAAAVLDGAGTLPFPVAVRITTTRITSDAPLGQRIGALVARGASVWLAVDAPDPADNLDQWRDALRRLLAEHAESLTVLEVRVADQDPALAAFALRLASTEARTFSDRIRVALGGPRVSTDASRADVYTRDLTPYIDLLSVPPAEADRAAAWLSRIHPSAALALTPPATTGGGDADALTRTALDTMLRFSGSTAEIVAVTGGEPLVTALQALSPVSMLLSADVADLDDAGAALALSTGGNQVTRSLPHRLLFDNRTFATYLAYWGPASNEPL